MTIPPTPRVALYARYSSDNQRDASIEDQLRICREKAEREKWTIVSTYKDAGISGASMILRPGIQTLLQDAQRQQFDIVLAEALDRISRDQADVATLFKHLRFAGVPIDVIALDGEVAPSTFAASIISNCPTQLFGQQRRHTRCSWSHEILRISQPTIPASACPTDCELSQ